MGEIRLKIKKRIKDISEEKKELSDNEDETPTINNNNLDEIDNKNEDKIKELQTVIKVKEDTNADEPKETVQDNSSKSGENKLHEKMEENKDAIHSIKEFEFQISENQDNINKLMEKTDNIIKDLDDLVSLYEIVSEQMNPFVGLSKVTKKRIEALENFTKELENVKNRLENVESDISDFKSNSISSPIIDFNPKKYENNKTINKEVSKEKNQDNADFREEYIENSNEIFELDSFIDNLIDEIFIKNIK